MTHLPFERVLRLTKPYATRAFRVPQKKFSDWQIAVLTKLYGSHRVPDSVGSSWEMSTDPYSPRVTVCRSEGSDPSELFGRNLAAFVAAQCQWARQLSRSESTTPDSPQVRSRRFVLAQHSPDRRTRPVFRKGRLSGPKRLAGGLFWSGFCERSFSATITIAATKWMPA